MASLPANVAVSTHPLVTTKLSLLRSTGTPSIVVRSLTEYDEPAMVFGLTVRL